MEKKEINDNEIIDQRQADEIAQSLNIVLNNATFYGADHPSTMNGSENLVKILEKVFPILPTVTFLRTGESLYIDKYCVDRKINANRFLTTFHKTGIESISFFKGVKPDCIKVFIKIFSNYMDYGSVAKMDKELKAQQVSNIRFNYVYFQKVTKDETVVNKDSIGELLTGSQKEQDAVSVNTPNPCSDAEMKNISNEGIIEQIGKLLSLKSVLDSPQQAAGTMLNQTTGNVQQNPLVSQLQLINQQFSDQNLQNLQQAENVSMDELMESVFKLITELKHGLATQKEMGKIIQEEGQVIDEVDRLSFQAIVQLVREEYKTGSISVQRLSYLIRRIIPDIKDLKRLLPQLREGLLAEGMPIGDFLQLIKELRNELKDDSLIQTLELGVQEIGLTTDEVIQAITVNPQEAAKLIILGAEIRKNTGDDSSNLSQMLSDYIESAGQKMALNAQSNNQWNGEKVLKNVIQQIESKLLDKLKEHGVDDDVINEVEEQLATRFPKTLNKLKSDWIVNNISREKDFTNVNFLRLMDSALKDQKDFEVVRQPIENALLANGFEKNQVYAIFKNIISRVIKKKEPLPLPKNILSQNNTKFFIHRLIKERFRYHNPFSCINISVGDILSSEVWQAATSLEVSHIVSHICQILPKLLRDIDLIGSLSDSVQDNLFIILPMTEEKGANIVKKRLDTNFTQLSFKLNNKSIKADIIISVTPFIQDKTPTYESYLDLIIKKHDQEKKRHSKKAKPPNKQKKLTD